MKTTARFDARELRNTLLKRDGPDEVSFIRFVYRAFDTRWLYWEKDTKLLEEKRTDYRPHKFDGNFWPGSSKRVNSSLPAGKTREIAHSQAAYHPAASWRRHHWFVGAR